ncbi:MAG TPA: LysM peptidoglycan-binding domain-containing protein [Anaerolineae bacterium]|nr:LysM peptidoglycan-binding domain-containing protein [Anaerolineae bacterium]
MNSDSMSAACPYLGCQHDPDSHFAYPHAANYCYAQENAKPVELTFQSEACLSGNWTVCPRYSHTERAKRRAYPSLVAAAQARRSRERRIAAAVVGGVLVVVALIAAVRWFAGPSSGMASPTAAPSRTVVAAALPTATATMRPTFTPTPAPSATPTVFWSVTPLPALTPSATVTLPSSPTATAPTHTPTVAAPVTPTVSPTATPAPNVQPPALGWSVVHVVQPRDFVARIAQRYGATVADVVEANELDNPSVIYRGQVLLVPLASAQKALAATPVLTGSQESGGELPLPAPAPNGPAEPASSGSVELTWRAEQPLEEGQYFALYLWWEEQQAPSLLTLLTKPAYTLDLTGRAAGTYHWAVRVVEGRRDGALQILHRNLSPLSKRIAFEWTAP